MDEVKGTVARGVSAPIGATIKTPPAPHTIRIYTKDGTGLDVFPVDAKEIVAGGEYSYEPPVADVSSEPTQDPVEPIGPTLDPPNEAPLPVVAAPATRSRRGSK